MTAPLAGRLVTIKVGGTPTTMTGEACEQVSGVIYRVASSSKRILDPSTAITVYDDGEAKSESTIFLDYSAGLITLDGPPSGPVTVDAKYIPLVSVAYAKSLDVQLPTKVWADVTCLGDAAARKAAVADVCTMSLGHFYLAEDDVDATGGTLLLSTLLAQDAIFCEVAISTSQTLYGWFAPVDAKWRHSLTDALEGTLELEGIVRTCVGRPVTEQALFSLVTN